MHSRDESLYRFGLFSLDTSRRRLTRDGQPVHLTPKAVDLLGALVRRAGELVTKEQLLVEVWPGTAVEENNLARHVSMLRKALRDSPQGCEYIVTVQGQGYRFLAQVEPGEAPALAHQLAASPAAAPPAARAGRRFLGPLMVGAGVVLVLTGSIWLSGATSATAPEPVQRRLGQLTYEPGLQLHPTWSPDGGRLAYASDQGGNFDIWVQPLGSPGEVRLTTSPAQDWQPAWSPDGRWVAFRSERDGGGLFIVSEDGRVERRLTTFGYRPQWSPAGTSLLFSTSAYDLPRGTLHVVGLDGREPTALVDPVLTDLRTANAAWFPDGDRVSIWGSSRKNGWTFTTITLSTGRTVGSHIPPEITRALQDAGLSLGRFVWSRNRERLFFEGRSQEVSGVWRVTVNPRTLAWTAGPERLTTGTADSTDLALSPDGTRLAFSSQQGTTRLWALPLDLAAGRLTGEGRALTSGGAGEFDAAAPADGHKVAFRRIREGRQEVWEQATDGSQPRLLMASRDWFVSSPRWSSDGTRLAFSRSKRGLNGPSVDSTIIMSPLTGVEQVVATPPGRSLVPDDWSADGEWLVGACRHAAGEPMGICVLSVSAERPSWRLIAADRTRALLSPRFSPNQQWISFMAVDFGSSVSTLYVMPASGGVWTAITDGRAYEDKPRWAPDGKAIYFVSSTGGFANVLARRFDSDTGRPFGAPFALTGFDSPNRMLPAASRVEISVASRALFIPITEGRAHLWLLDHADR